MNKREFILKKHAEEFARELKYIENKKNVQVYEKIDIGGGWLVIWEED